MAPLSESPGMPSTRSHTGRLAQVARGTCGPFALRPTTSRAKLWLGPTRLSHLKRAHGRVIDREVHLLPAGESKWLAKKAGRRRFRVRVYREGVSAVQRRLWSEAVSTEEARDAQPDWLKAREAGDRRRDVYMSDREARDRGRAEAEANDAHHPPPGTASLVNGRRQPTGGARRSPCAPEEQAER